jgi:glutamate/aspartate transport system substrate-binding protein
MLRAMSFVVALFVSSGAALAQTAVPTDSRLKSISDTKVIRIAFRADASPFSFKDEKGEATGYSLDLCRLIVHSIAQQISVPDLKTELVPVTVQTRFSAIADGQADMECGSSTVTLSRMKQVDFSNVIFVGSTGVLVKRADNLTSIADLAGKKIAVVSGTTNERAVRDQNKESNFNIAVVSMKDRDESIGALEARKVDGYASDKLLLLGAILNLPNLYVMLPEDLSIEPYAIALPRGDWALRLAINMGLAEAFRSGQAQAIHKRWFEPLGLEPGALMKAVYALGALSN